MHNTNRRNDKRTEIHWVVLPWSESQFSSSRKLTHQEWESISTLTDLSLVFVEFPNFCIWAKQSFQLKFIEYVEIPRAEGSELFNVVLVVRSVPVRQSLAGHKYIIQRSADSTFATTSSKILDVSEFLSTYRLLTSLSHAVLNYDMTLLDAGSAVYVRVAGINSVDVDAYTTAQFSTATIVCFTRFQNATVALSLPRFCRFLSDG